MCVKKENMRSKLSESGVTFVSRGRVVFPCSFCGATAERSFSAYQNNKTDVRYCSLKCRKLRAKVKATCKECGVEFLAIRSQNRQYCSRLCNIYALSKKKIRRVKRKPI